MDFEKFMSLCPKQDESLEIFANCGKSRATLQVKVVEFVCAKKYILATKYLFALVHIDYAVKSVEFQCDLDFVKGYSKYYECFLGERLEHKGIDYLKCTLFARIAGGENFDSMNTMQILSLFYFISQSEGFS